MPSPAPSRTARPRIPLAWAASLMLAVGAVPGSLFPQRPANPSIVTQYIKDNPDYGKILDSLQLYDVYSTVPEKGTVEACPPVDASSSSD